MRALSSMATRHVLRDLLDAASAAGFADVELEAVGGVDAAERVAAGEELDLVFLAAGALARLADAGHVDAASVRPLLLSQVAVGVPSTPGDPERAERPSGPAFGDAAGVQAALRAASGIGYSTGPSGTALLEWLDRWGLADELSERLVQARPGVPVATLLAQGQVDLGFQQLSELVGQPDVRILGVLPPDCAIDTVFAGAVATTCTDPAAARGVLNHLASDAVAAIRADHAFDAPQ